MSVYFERTTRSPLPVQELYERSRSIDAHQESMARSRERAVAGVTSGGISLGEEVTWRAWHFGLPLSMTSRITEMEPPHRFVDEQVRGPFRSFRHEHEFRGEQGGSVMIDRIEFTAPLGLLGRAAERLFLAAYLENLIDVRNRYLAAP
ncbi:SRPBCC family protein [Arthrobacter sp. TMN-37]